MSDFIINKVHRKTLNQIVYENIRNSILQGEIKAGTKLAEVTIARQMSVSPTPVREAFRMLATEGLVRIEPWKGAVVQSVSDSGQLDVAQCRCALEILAFELWFPKKSVSDITLLEELLHSSAKFESDSDFVKASISLHNVWICGSENKKLCSLLSQIVDPMIQSRYQLLPGCESRMRAFSEHAAIVDLIKEDNFHEATSVLKDHILQGYYSTNEVRQSMTV